MQRSPNDVFHKKERQTATAIPLAQKRHTIALIGLGHIGEIQVHALSVGNAFRLLDVSDSDVRRRAILPRGVRFFANVGDLLTNTTADLVMISTPPSTHFEIASTVIHAGKNLLLEKPATLSEQQLDQLFQLAAQRRSMLSVAFHAAEALDLRWFLQQWNNGSLSDAKLVHIDAAFYDPYVQNGRLETRAAALGGAWFDSGINALSVIVRILGVGTCEIGAARCRRMPQLGCSEIQANIEFRFYSPIGEGGGRIDTDWTLGLNRKQTILRFSDGTTFMLNHSNEQVWRDGEIIADLRTEHSRLVNHYIGVFTRASEDLESGKPDTEFIRDTHRLYFRAISALT